MGTGNGTNPDRGTAGSGGRTERPRSPGDETPGGLGGPGALEGLGTEELLGLVLGAPRELVRGRAESILARRPLAVLSRSGAAALRQEAGLSGPRALRLAAAFALGRRVEREAAPAGLPLRRPESVHRLVAPELRGLERETFLVLLLDAKHRLKRLERISEGTLDSSLVHPREVFRAAVREAAAALIAVHNHPSGDPEPSVEDLEVTRRLIEAGRILGVPLLDHVVVGGARWVSLRERLPFGEAAASRAANELRVSRRLERD